MKRLLFFIALSLFLGVALHAQQAAPAQEAPRLPRLIDLGSESCVPCKMMMPVLEELRRDYAGKLEVVFINVRQNPSASRTYGIRAIPTQIFYDASGKELYRHEGFMARGDVVKKCVELGMLPPQK